MRLKIKRKEILALPYARQHIFFVGLNILLIAFVLLTLNLLPPEIPLYYGRAFGEAQLAAKHWLILPIVLALLISLVDFLIIFLLEDSFLHRIMLALSFVATLLSAVTVYKIYILVGNI